MGYLSTLLAVLCLFAALRLAPEKEHRDGTRDAAASGLVAGSAALFVVGFRQLRDRPAATGRPHDGHESSSRGDGV